MNGFPLALLLLPIAGLGLATLFNDDDQEDETGGVDPTPPEGEGEETGLIRGTAGDDTIAVTGSETSVLSFDVYAEDGALGLISNTETGESIEPGLNGDDTLTGLSQVRGGAGDDRISVSGQDVLIDGEAGADLIDLTDAGNVLVHGGAGDTILGAESGEAIYLLSDGVTFLGTDADDSLTAGGASDIRGDGGDDHLRTTGGDTTLSGGAGDDTLNGSFTYDEYAQTANTYRMNDGAGDDVLDGGAGNDQLLFDHADHVTGGEGADRFVGELTAGETATITDFTPGTERIDLTVDGVQVTAALNEVRVVEEDGNTLLQDADGATFLRIENATGLTIAYQPFDGTFTGYGDHVDGNGDPIDPNAADVTLRGFYQVVYA